MKNNPHPPLQHGEGIKFASILIIVLVIMLFITIPLIAQPNDPIARNRAQERLHQAVYHIQSQAQQSGWTDDLNLMAGDIYAQMGDIPRMVAYWERANLVDDGRLSLLADGYIQLADWAGAVDTLQRFMVINPQNDWARWHLSAILAPTDNLRAQTLLFALPPDSDYSIFAERILPILATDAPPHDKALQVGLVLAYSDQWHLAEIAFRQVALLTPNSGMGLAYVGLARYMQGKTADNWLAQAVQIEPENDQIQYVYGIYLRGMGQLNASLQAFGNAINQMPSNPAYYVELGMTYHALNDTAQAEYWLQFATEISGGSQAIQDILDNFYADQQQSVFDFDALNVLLEATPEITPEATAEITPSP